MTIYQLLVWAVAGTSLVLFMIAVWWWLDVRADYLVTKRSRATTVEVKESVRRSSLGMSRLAWLRLLDGALWLSIGSLVFIRNQLAPTGTRYAGLVMLLLLMIVEIAKLLTDRWTRYQIDGAVVDELSEERSELLSISSMVEQKHKEVMGAIAKNTDRTEAAATAAHEAYTEANHVNQKIQDLNKRLLEQEHGTEAKEKIEVGEAMTDSIQKIEKHTADSAKSLKVIKDKAAKDVEKT